MGANKREKARHLIDAIMRKLEANENVIEQSLDHGRLSWRIDKAGRVTVKLEPTI